MYVSRHKLKVTKDEFARMSENSGGIIVSYIHELVMNKQENFLGIWVGKPGKGKSWGALRTCEVLMEKFGRRMTMKYVVGDIPHFMGLLKELSNRHERGEDVRGTCILYDEAGISMDNRMWQEQMHKVMNDCAEIFRFLGLVVMFTVPGQGRIDKKLRELIHGMWNPKSKARDYIKCKFYLLEQNVTLDKEFKRHVVVTHHGWRGRVTWVKIHKPSRELATQYQEWMKRMKYAIIEKAHSSIDVEKDVEVKERKILTERQQQIYRMAQAGLFKAEIAQQLGINPESVHQHLRAIKAKGYTV